jgi:nucleotidyltransferase substrate binding protein (TIGR01987 family)
MQDKDIRWIQRLSNYIKAFNQLKEGVELSGNKTLSNLEKQGLIQAFEFTHELAWNVIKDFFEYQGNTLIHGSRDATREAFNSGLIEDGHVWMDMIISRNKGLLTYDKETAEDIIFNIKKTYLSAFEKFKNKMQELKHSREGILQ